MRVLLHTQCFYDALSLLDPYQHGSNLRLPLLGEVRYRLAGKEQLYNALSTLQGAIVQKRVRRKCTFLRRSCTRRFRGGPPGLPSSPLHQRDHRSRVGLRSPRTSLTPQNNVGSRAEACSPPSGAVSSRSMRAPPETCSRRSAYFPTGHACYGSLEKCARFLMSS